jgi:alpha-tubulin suppressor-like RCC1 family protein
MRLRARAAIGALAAALLLQAAGQASAAAATPGTPWTWGGNDFGELGDGTTANRTTPVAVAGLAGVAAVTAGRAYTAALVAP